MKRMVAVLISIMICMPLFSRSRKGPLTVLAADGTTLAVLSSSEDAAAHPAADYLEEVLAEAASVLAQKNKWDQARAAEALMTNAYTVKTAYSREVSEALAAALSEERISAGAAVTDLEGGVLAVLSVGDRNYALLPTSPYSAIKPLTVYGPAMEAGRICWSSLYEDAPVKQVKDGSGIPRPWPYNANQFYTLRKMDMADALKRSLNTIAVRVAMDYGIMNSLTFLRDRFGVQPEYEWRKVNEQGEEEILANVALGYLYEGFSPLRMAGFYQCFAARGVYTVPAAIREIFAADGSTVYQRRPQTIQTFSPETACVMNHLLREVTSPDGTGAKAALPDIPTAGKTGTGDRGAWFVGVTPAYSCAIWHGAESATNHAPEIFARAVGAFPASEKTEFPEEKTVMRIPYCPESGGRYSNGCGKMKEGYFTADPGPCTVHGA
ncbi:MAG: penicillin-binding protein [Clostridia bacterium]|nr:penicillin-binding protein [Clostridia bacterium]